MTSAFRLCAPCAVEAARWLDYRPLLPVTLVQIGTGTNLRLIADERRARGDRWAELVRFQRELIREHCEYGHRYPWSAQTPIEADTRISTLSPD